MKLPEHVKQILHRLNRNGYAAYAVGGCVRDSILGKQPKDWDICTSALPEQMQEVFTGWHTVETGLKHGTLTVVLDHLPYEVTTFRVDGTYTDHRHPDSVSFVDRIDQDLARRDFTVNAMAYNDETGIIDLFEGQDDLRRGLIRCVGDAETRFGEDALRILRALRFASVYDFDIESETARAIHHLYPSLDNVAGERIREELLKFLCGKRCGILLREYADVFCRILPELKPTLGFVQNNPHHLYDVWEHTVRGVETVDPDPVLKLVMLLHDTGKPLCMTLGEDGVSHYNGHPALSAKQAEKAAERLRLDRVTADDLITLTAAHDVPFDCERRILLRRLNRYGEKNFRRLIRIRRADRIATGTVDPVQMEAKTVETENALNALLDEKPCFTLKDLAVNGRDLTAMGLRGKEVGEKLNELLRKVMDGKVMNNRDALLEQLNR